MEEMKKAINSLKMDLVAKEKVKEMNKKVSCRLNIVHNADKEIKRWSHIFAAPLIFMFQDKDKLHIMDLESDTEGERDDSSGL